MREPPPLIGKILQGRGLSLFLYPVAMKPQATTIMLDPEWHVMRRYDCAHLVFACCVDHLDPACPICDAPYTPPDMTEAPDSH